MNSNCGVRASFLAIAAALLLAVVPAQAKWPEKPIRVVLPFGPGGVGDVTARVLADKLGEKLGQRVVVENMPGPGGIAAARAVTTASADGYTMAWVTNGTATSVATFKNLPFDPLKDFAMVSMVGAYDLVLVADAQSPYGTLADFISAAKANPGKMNIGSIAVGSAQNLGAELLRLLTDIKVQIIPYKSSPDIVIAMLRNDVQLMIDFPPSVAGQVEAGKLKILATSGPSPSPLLPGVPTVTASGVPGFELVSWNGLAFPKDTPQEIVDAMGKTVRELVATPEIKSAFAKVGVVATASTSAEMKERLIADIKLLNGVVDKAGIERK
jgi:putative tricarboxylic transport membrane protein